MSTCLPGLGKSHPQNKNKFEKIVECCAQLVSIYDGKNSIQILLGIVGIVGTYETNRQH